MDQADPDIILWIERFKRLDSLSESAACYPRTLGDRTKAQQNMEEKDKNPWAVGMAQAMKSTGDRPPLSKSTIKKAHEIARKIDEDEIEEKWREPTTVSPKERGKYEGKTRAELLKSYNSLKARGPHARGSKEYGRMKELAFAIRAKSGWGKVKEEE